MAAIVERASFPLAKTRDGERVSPNPGAAPRFQVDEATFPSVNRTNPHLGLAALR